MMNVIAILDTMWGSSVRRQAPRFFKINPKNFSGRRLYQLIQPSKKLIVTDACKELVSASHEHGTPDPKWLSRNLKILFTLNPHFNIILVCGKVAQSTFKVCGFQVPSGVRVIEIPHPAARGCWNKEYIQQVQRLIQGES